MSKYQEGDSIQGGCKNCRKVVNATLIPRSYSIENGLGLVENALMAVCNECDEVIGIPSQSTVAVRNALDKINGEIHQMIVTDIPKRRDVTKKPKELLPKEFQPTALQLNTLKNGNVKIAT